MKSRPRTPEELAQLERDAAAWVASDSGRRELAEGEERARRGVESANRCDKTWEGIPPFDVKYEPHKCHLQKGHADACICLCGQPNKRSPAKKSILPYAVEYLNLGDTIYRRLGTFSKLDIAIGYSQGWCDGREKAGRILPGEIRVIAVDTGYQYLRREIREPS